MTCMQSTVYVEALEDGTDMDAACEKDKDAIAELAGNERIAPEHVAEAIQYRSFELMEG